MKKKIYIPILLTVTLLSSCYAQALIEFRRVERALLAENDSYDIANKYMRDAFFLFSERQYYFHIEVGPGDDIRPRLLSFMNEAAETDYIVSAFRRIETFSDSSLSSNSDFLLYRGDISVAGTPCASYPCAVYWLEDRIHGEVFVSVNSF